MTTMTRMRSAEELRALATFCRDAIETATSEGRTPEARLYELLEQHEAQLARQEGDHVASTRVDDGVPNRGMVKDSLGRNREPSGAGGAHRISEKQVAFVKRLIAEKNTDGLTLPEDVSVISKKSASALIERLMGRPAKPVEKVAGATPVRGTASEKQVAFLNRLLGEKDLSGTAFPSWDAELIGQLTSREASAGIDLLLTLPRKVAKVAGPVAELTAGAYRLGDRVIRVYLGKQSGKMLAAELVDAASTDRDEAWKYLGMASRFVPADAVRMTVEECEAASAGSADHGWCCVCGRGLDDPSSVARGIGPVCRAKQGV